MAIWLPWEEWSNLDRRTVWSQAVERQRVFDLDRSFFPSGMLSHACVRKHCHSCIRNGMCENCHDDAVSGRVTEFDDELFDEE